MSTTTARPTSPRKWLALLPFLAAVTVVAVVGSLAAGSASETYEKLDLPAFAPPSWLFGPTWTVLYVMIAVAGWLLWRAGSTTGLVLWGLQLVLNLAWTPLFFGADRLGWALVDILALDLLVVATIAVAWRHSRPAAWLLVPYLAWIGFATALNAAILRLN